MSLKIRSSGKYDALLFEKENGFRIQIDKNKEIYISFIFVEKVTEEENFKKYFIFFKRKIKIPIVSNFLNVHIYELKSDPCGSNIDSFKYKSDDWFYKEVHNLLRFLIIKKKDDDEKIKQKQFAEKDKQVIKLLNAIK